MTPAEFVAKWSHLKNRLNELAASQQHFNDLCQLVGEPAPYTHDIDPKVYRFEKSAEKPDGNKGRADVFFQDRFIWEYKGIHGNLDKAYQQVQRYREALDNPPLLIVSDLDTIRIHTNFTGYPSRRTDIKMTELLQPEKLHELKMCFAHPDDITAFFRPEKTQEYITQATAETFVHVVDELKGFDKVDTAPEKFAHFVVRLLFCLFAEDMGLLPDQLFKQIAQHSYTSPEQFQDALRRLFQSMQSGTPYGFHTIPYFNGNLFDDDFVPPLPGGFARTLLEAARQDWSGIEPSIFGTLFERVIDKQKRAQLGAHYTSKDDIMLIVKPVLMEPLEREWDEVRRAADRAQRKGDPDKAHALLAAFSAKIASTTVLDPACGSGNFLYVALRQLLDLQKQVIVYTERNNLSHIPLTVSPRQIYGIEINIYAQQLAQVTIWMGYIQWRVENGYTNFSEPILQSLNQIERRDAILTHDASGNPAIAPWPTASVIVGNPPFLGGQRMRTHLGDTYVEQLRSLHGNYLHGQTDLVTYWFELARRAISEDRADRAGFIATQSIRASASRAVLDRIKESGDIFFAWSDREWVLEGASVRVALIGFDNGELSAKRLDGQQVRKINANLTATVDVSDAQKLSANEQVAFMGIIRVGKFELTETQALKMIDADPKNHTVVKRWIRARDITDRPQKSWIIDFGTTRSQEEAAQFTLPFKHIEENVYPIRKNNRRKLYARRWWLFGESRSGMRNALAGLERFITTPLVSKYRLFVWQDKDVIADCRVLTFATQSDYVFGVLHSRIHELWALKNAARHGDGVGGGRPTYNVTTCFETFPFPWILGKEPAETENSDVEDIADTARALVTFRQAWLHPQEPLNGGISVAHKKRLKKRTLTNMYNALTHFRDALVNGTRNSVGFKTGWQKAVKSDFTIAQAERLHDIHTDLDEAVLRAYGWPTTLSDEEILERLLALNLERAGD